MVITSNVVGEREPSKITMVASNFLKTINQRHVVASEVAKNVCARHCEVMSSEKHDLASYPHLHLYGTLNVHFRRGVV